LNFNAETSNLKERPLKSQRIEVEEHPYESLIVESQEIPFKSSTLNVNKVDGFSIERDPGKRLPMWDYPVNRRDKIRMAYLKARPYQILRQDYPFSGPKKSSPSFSSFMVHTIFIFA
jgi:hypothetical protein